MKKFATTLLALAAIGAFASQASAASLMFDGFSYPDGDLVPNGGWAVHSGAIPIDIQVVAGRAVAACANTADDNRTFTAQPLTSPTYACFDAIIADPGAVPRAVYFAHLKDTGITNLVSRVYVLPVAGSAGFTFGLSYSSTSATVGAVPWSVGSLTYGTLYRIVIKYDPATLTSNMWVDPVNEASTNVSQTGTAAAIAVSSFALRQSNANATQPATAVPSGTANWTASVDNVGVGITFDDACSGPPTSNRSGTWGQVKVMYR